MDLNHTARELQKIEERLERQVQPVRERIQRLGASGLYALAAAEQRRADVAQDPAQRAIHLSGADAAQALGDIAAGVGGRAAG
jgi:hypothetical protein